MTSVGRVGELWRYPVKSMRGERLAAAHVDSRGITGDRVLAVYDAEGKIGSGKITRRFRPIAGLRALIARTDASAVVIEARERPVTRTDAFDCDIALSASVGQPVSLRREADIAHHDAAPVHLISTASLREISARVGRTLDVFPFRPNIIVETDAPWPAEEDWIGRVIAIGDAVRLRIVERTERCIMVNALAEGGADERIIRTITRSNGSCLGVYATVETFGEIRDGDAIFLTGDQSVKV